MSRTEEAELKDILKEEYLLENTTPEDNSEDNQGSSLTNSKDIYCECKTLILRSKHAKLIVPSESMRETEKSLMFLQSNNEFFKNLTRGCYWLVDDIYKFEQMGYTKELKTLSTKPSSSQDCVSEKDTTQQKQSQSHDSTNQDVVEQKQMAATAPDGLRYLACAECHLCPLGWFDPRTKESYLYVW